ncbi:MAG: response regulator transcription factor [Spirochaetales bacterium]|nr:response regulator transcription factor [Spirochaetales bacterium]
MAKKQVRFILVDDHPISREGLVYLINDANEYSVIAEASNAEEALEIVDKKEVDFAVIDISLKGMSGLQLIRKLKNKYPELYILVVSMHDETLYAERALDTGADGYIMKEEASNEVLKAIRQILSGKIYLSDVMQKRMMMGMMKKRRSAISSIVDKLSDREFEIFQLIAKGMGPALIAKKLNVSVKTVETHRNNIKIKFNLSTAFELREFAINWFKNKSR